MGYAQRLKHGRLILPNSAMEEVVEQQRVRELAAQIENEAQLQKILDDCDPALRDEVEKQIRPWVTFDAPEKPTRPTMLDLDGDTTSHD